MRYDIFKHAKGYYWHLTAANNKIIAWSGEYYHNKADCLAAINLVKGSGNAPVYDRS